jgi:hypothetical protein
MDTLLLGANTTSKTNLTHKQREFAREIAMGETKAGAYRKAYNSKGKAKTASTEGQKLVKNPSISTQIEAFKVAIEAQKYTTPAHLRALAIHKITEKALDPDVPPAQQLKALELLGKITEVSLFTHRIEQVQTVSSDAMREKLMESIRLAISNSKAIDIEAHQADDLLAEIARGKTNADDVEFNEVESNNVMADNNSDDDGGEGIVNENLATLLPTDPQFSSMAESPDLHSIPHIQSPVNSALTHVNPGFPTKSNTYDLGDNPNTGTPPVNVSNEQG